MAPVFTNLYSRDDTVQSASGLSTTVIAGIAVVGVAAVGLAIFLVIMYLRKRRQHAADVEAGEKAPRTLEVQPSIQKEPLPADLQAIKSPSGLIRSVSRRNLTVSVILPTPVPPVPAARQQPSRLTPSREAAPAVHPSNRLSSAEILAHHTTTGTMPRAFAPAPVSPTTKGPFSFALDASPTRATFNRTPSPSHSLDVPRPNSTASFSRLSILSASLRNSSLNNSISSLSSATAMPGGAEVRKVRRVFTPLLPDELVLRPGEKVTLIQSYEDGWCVVGRKSPSAAKASFSASDYAFGQSKNVRGSADEVEIGVVPLWVFDKRTAGSVKDERPMRSSSLGITLILNESERNGADARDDVISWSNF